MQPETCSIQKPSPKNVSPGRQYKAGRQKRHVDMQLEIGPQFQPCCSRNVVLNTLLSPILTMEDGRQTFPHASTKRMSSQSKSSEETQRQQTSSLSPHKSHKNQSGDFIHFPKLWLNRTLSKRLLGRPEFQAKGTFKRAIEKVICLLRVSNTFLSFLGDGSLPEKYGSLQYFVNIVDVRGNGEEEESTGNETNSQKPLFDPAWFRANREIRLGSETKAILSQEPSTRTAEQVQTVFRYLYTLPSFAEYPLYHQKAICQDASYQSFGTNVTIVKQGDRADNFYFVLSGSATVISKKESFHGEDNGDNNTESVSVVKRGMAFGEAAIMTNSRRMVTVVSKTPIELLVVSKEDYARIFFGRDAESGKKEYISFLRTIDFLRNWPVDILKSHPEKSQHCYFRRGTVIVRNSNNSPWLYVVKSGVCEVLVRLNAVKPRKAIGKEVRQLSCLEELTKLTLEQRLDFRKRKDKVDKLPAIPQIKDKRIYQRLQRRRTTLCFVPEQSLPSSRRCSKDSSAKIDAIVEENMQANFHGDINTDSGKTSSATPDSTATELTTWPSNLLKLSKSFNQTSSWRKSNTVSSCNNDDSNSLPRRARSFSLPSTISGDLLKFRRQPKPAFVQIDLLHSKRVFGLSELDFEYNALHPGRPASVSLVSRGAECIMISKKFFMEHANALTKRWIRLNVQPYLPMEKHQQTLQDKVDWETFKKKIVASVVY